MPRPLRLTPLLLSLVSTAALSTSATAQEVGLRPNETEQQNATTLRDDANRADAIRQSINQNRSGSNSSSAYNDIGNAASASLHQLGQQLTNPGLSPEFLAESDRRWQAEIKHDEEVRARNAAAAVEERRAANAAAKADHLRQLWALADQNDAHALETLYGMYKNGDDVVQDAAKAQELQLRAMALGSTYACQEFERSGPEQSRLVAEFIKAGDAGCHYAKYVACTTLMLGKGDVAKDWHRAMELCVRWADAGDEWCQLEAMYAYRFGEGRPADLDRAAPWMLSLARVETDDDKILIDYINLVSAAQFKSPDITGISEVLRTRAAAGHPLPAQERLLALRIITGGPLPADPTTGLALLHIALAHGSSDAQLDFAELQQRGEVVPRDEAAAHRLFAQLAAQSPRAQYHSALDLLAGTGVAADAAEGLRQLRLAADRKWPDAQYQLGLRLAAGVGVAPDDVQAVAMVAAATDAGCVAAQVLSARWAVTRTHGSRHSNPEAFAWAQQAAAQGELDAQWIVGRYDADDQHDPARAAAGQAAVRRAAAAGCAGAEYDLGMWLMAGDHGATQDEAAGLASLRSASTHGFALAQELVGSWQLLGEHGLPHDPAAAALLLKAAAADGVMLAQREFGLCLLHGTGVAPDGPAALAMLGAAAAAEDPQAMLVLGAALVDGDTVIAADPPRGWALLQAAVEGADGALRIRISDHLLTQPGDRTKVLGDALSVLRPEELGSEPAELEHWRTIYGQLHARDPDTYPTLMEDTPAGRIAVASRKAALALLAHPPAGMSQEEALRQAMIQLDYAARWGDRSATFPARDAAERYAALKPGVDVEKLLDAQVAILYRQAGQRILAEGFPGLSRAEICESALFQFQQAARLGDTKATELIAAARPEYMRLRPDAKFDELFGPEPAEDKQPAEDKKPGETTKP